MTQYYASPVVDPPLVLYRGDDEQVEFIIWTDRTMTARLDISLGALFCTVRRWWDYNDYDIFLSTVAGTIVITNGPQGEFYLDFYSTDTMIDPGAYQYDIVLVLAGDTSVLRRDGLDIKPAVT